MFHFGELLEVSSTEFQIIESPLSVSIVNMSDLRLEGKELSVSSPFGVYAKAEKKRRWFNTDSKRQMGLYRKHDAPFPTAIKGLTELTYHWTKTYPC